MLFLIAYDIADPSRLAKTARLLVRHAQRCQKSIFLYEGTTRSLGRLIEKVRPLVNPEQDIVQAWRLGREESPQGLFLGKPAFLMPDTLILGGSKK